MNQVNPVMKKMKYLLKALIMAVPIAVLACTNYQDEDTLEGLSVSVSELAFSSVSSRQPVTVSSGLKWDVYSKPEWISIHSIDQSFSSFEWVLSLSATENDGFYREGVVTIKTQRETTDVKVSQEGKRGKYVAVESVSVSPNELSLTKGDKAQLEYDIYPSDASIKTVSWKSNSPSVVSVDENGAVSAIEEGSAVIIATTDDGNKTASCVVTVNSKTIPVTGISLDKTSLTLTEGDSYTLTVTVTPADATDKTVIWSSSDNNVASVDNGVIIANKEGVTTILAEANDKIATCLVNVIRDSLNDVISFVDLNVKSALVKAFDTNGDGELSYAEALWVASIEDVFSGIKDCRSFDEFQFFSNVKAIPSKCFENSLLESITLPKSILKIEDYAFSGCARLTSIVLNNSLESILWGAFSDCVCLEEIILPQSLKSLGSNAFSGCSDLRSITVPDSIKTIPIGAFNGCANMSYVSLPSYLESIETEAFKDCRNLTSIVFPNTLKKVGVYAFSHTGLIKVVVPDSVDDVGMGAFSGCFNLIGIVLPKNMTVIPSCFLERCTNLSSIDIPNSVMTIGSNAFQYTSLVSVIIPERVARIEDKAFYQCGSMKSVTLLPVSVPKGGDDMFGGINISNLNDLDYSIFVPDESVEAYKAAQYWSEYASRISSISGPVQVVSLDYSLLTLEEGQSTTLKATTSPSDASGKTISWSSSNTAVATVSNGLVTAINSGTTRITASAGDLSASCTITVYSKTTPVYYLTFTSIGESSLTLYKVNGHRLPSLFYSYDTIKWSRMDSNTPLVFTGSSPIYVCGVNKEGFNNANEISQFTSEGSDFYCSGNVMSLLDYLGSVSSIPCSYCFERLFYYCGNLLSAPTLPAELLSVGCYKWMFSFCRKLSSAPELPASILKYECYQQMFQGCTYLSSITCLATDISANSCTGSWLDGVSPSGVFTKKSSMSSWETGGSGIPEGWIIKNK